MKPFIEFKKISSIILLLLSLFISITLGSLDLEILDHSNSSPNQTCQMFANIKSLTFTPQSINIQNQISMSPSTVQNPKGDYQDNQQILFISFGTNSISSYNNVDFSISKIGMITPNFSAEYLLL
jgi:hypothetical protein